MAKRSQLAAEPRELGHRALLTRLRRSGKVPGILYGHGDPLPIALDRRTVEEFLHHHGSSALLDLQLNGEPTTAMFKQVALDPVSSKVVHLDLLRVSMSDTVTTHVPLTFNGAEEVERDGDAVLTYQLSELAVSCRADHLPETIVVDLSELTPGHLIRIGDLQIPEGVTVTQGEDQVVVACIAPAIAEPDEAEEEAGAEAAPPDVAGASEAGERPAGSGE